jgi:DHA2 family multidrug resistance protein
MITFRALQGFAGGVLIPLAFTIIVTTLPKSKQPVGLAMFAVSATFAPAIGPTIGGYFTDNYGWPYVFYLNLVPGVIMFGALFWALKPSPMRLDLLKTGDWTGIAAMSVALGTLQTFLEEGNLEDWFESAFIRRLAVIAAVFSAIFIWIQLRKPAPVVNLSLLARRNFGVVTASNFFFGFGLYGSTYVLSQYLAQAQGYSSEQIGEVVMWTGLPQLVLIPFVPLLMKKFDTRIMVVLGLSIYAASCFMNLNPSRDYAADQLLVPNIVRAFGMALVLTPLSSLAMVGIAREDTGAASGLFNMLRNLGGAVGTAALATFVTKREQFHSNIINSHVSLADPATQTRLHDLQQKFMTLGITDPAAALHKAMIAIGHTVKAQATYMAFGDTFGLLGVALLAAAVLIPFARKGPAAGGGGAH